MRAKITITMESRLAPPNQRLVVSFPPELGSRIESDWISQDDIGFIQDWFQGAWKNLVKQLPPELYSCANSSSEASGSGSYGSHVSYLDAIRAIRAALADLSADFLAIVFPTNERELLGRLRRLRDAGAAGLLRFGEPAADIDVFGDLESVLPIEYVYLDWEKFDLQRDTEPWDESVGLPLITRRLSGFVGLSFNVRRIPSSDESFNPHDQLPVRGNQDRLGIRFYPYDGLSNVSKERAFFVPRNRHRFDLADFDLGDDAHTATRVVGSVLGAPNGPPIHHFACHFAPGGHGAVRDSCFVLGRGTQQFDVPIVPLARYRSQPPHGGWIAFVNACDVSTTTSLRRGGLVRLFWKTFRTACLIGPDIEVPDAFASEFARVFYAYWLRERDLGMALFKARWFFVLRERSPVALGLFYVYFAARPIRLEGVGPHVFL